MGVLTYPPPLTMGRVNMHKPGVPKKGSELQACIYDDDSVILHRRKMKFAAAMPKHVSAHVLFFYKSDY